MKKPILSTISLILFLGCMVSMQAQTTRYYPKGDPHKWNAEITPFVWLPAINGQVASERFSNDFNVPSVDLISNLKMAFMISGEISKEKFFLAPTYVYAKVGSEKVVWTSENEERKVLAIPDLKMNILEVIAGGRFRVNDVFIIDPFAGFRYTNYHIFGSIEGVIDTTSFDEKVDYWDPVVGFQMHYFPHPRVPIIFKADVGGFGAGSTLSWTASLNSGYTISPLLDLIAGISAYGSDFVKENTLGNEVGLNIIMYGFDIGIRVHIPKRLKDKSVFKKAK